jgi:hypothetical protein
MLSHARVMKFPPDLRNEPRVGIPVHCNWVSMKSRYKEGRPKSMSQSIANARVSDRVTVTCYVIGR